MDNTQIAEQVSKLIQAVGTLTTNVRDLMEMGRRHDGEIQSVREEQAQNKGINPVMLGSVIAIALTALGMAANMAVAWSSLKNRADVAETMLAEKKALIEQLQLTHMIHLEERERLTRLETALGMMSGGALRR